MPSDYTARMKYRRLANTGIYVSELCLGAMTFGAEWEVIGTLGQAEADAIVHRSIDAGINIFDTVDVYSTGDSEEILGRALATQRHDVLIATKVRGRMGVGPNDVGLSRLHIIDACEASLKRLGTGSFVIEVEVDAAADCEGIARQLVEPLGGTYGEVLIYFHERDATDAAPPLGRVQWTGAGYVTTTY